MVFGHAGYLINLGAPPSANRDRSVQSLIQEVTLAEELDFVRQYLAIEQVRFSDRLQPLIDVPPELLSAAVPEFLLQPLVGLLDWKLGARSKVATEEAEEEGGVPLLDVLEPTLYYRHGVAPDSLAPASPVRGRPWAICLLAS